MNDILTPSQSNLLNRFKPIRGWARVNDEDKDTALMLDILGLLDYDDGAQSARIPQYISRRRSL